MSGLLWGCVADSGYYAGAGYGAPDAVYVAPYYGGDPFWNGWGGGNYGGFYGRGYGGTRLYRGAGHRGPGASRGFPGGHGGHKH